MDKIVPTPPTGLSRLPARVTVHAAKPAARGAGNMFFLLRMAFWLGLVLVLLPTGTAQRAPASTEVSPAEAISAASATVGDLRGFCGRQPDACTVGSQMATAIGYKAQAGAKMLYNVLSDALSQHETGSLGNAATRNAGGTKNALQKPAIEQASQSTLTPADLAPSWRGPAPRKDSRHSA